MTRIQTEEPLVEIDSDHSFVPAGRQLAPERPNDDGRDHHGLTSPEETAYQFAVDRLNKTPDITPSSHTTEAEDDLMFHEVGFTSTTPKEMKDSWVAQYRALHPLPTEYSPLSAGDPALYVGERIVATIPISGPTDSTPPVTTSDGTAACTPVRTFNSLAEAMDTLMERATPPAASAPAVARGVTLTPAPSTPAAPSKLAEVIGTAVQVVEFAEAHPEAVARLGNLLRRLFQHAA